MYRHRPLRVVRLAGAIPRKLELHGEQAFELLRWEEGSEERKECEHIVCLYFNGWLFEGYDDAKSAILSSVLVALGEHKRFGPKVRDKCISLLKSVNWMRVAHLGLKHVAISSIKRVGEDMRRFIQTALEGITSWMQSSSPLTRDG